MKCAVRNGPPNPNVEYLMSKQYLITKWSTPQRKESPRSFLIFAIRILSRISCLDIRYWLVRGVENEEQG